MSGGFLEMIDGGGSSEPSYGELTDKAWVRIEPLLPPVDTKGDGGASTAR